MGVRGERHRGHLVRAPAAVAWLAAPAALAYLDSLGAEAVRTHNAELAREAGDLLIDAWQSEAAAAPDFCASMVSVRLPGVRGDRAAARNLAGRLNEGHGITVGVMALDGGVWVRVSAQIYNEIDDYRRLAAVGKTLAG
jgi:isopenicillin-N epimerase